MTGLRFLLAALALIVATVAAGAVVLLAFGAILTAIVEFG